MYNVNVGGILGKSPIEAGKKQEIVNPASTGEDTGRSSNVVDGAKLGVSLDISKEGMSVLEKSNDNNDAFLKDMYEEQLEASDKSTKAFTELAKMIEIARRIANGDKVPGSDEKKLMEFNSDMYQMAKTAAMLNENKSHKKYKTMFEDEEDKTMRDKLRNLEEDVATSEDSDTSNGSQDIEAPSEESVADE